MEFIARTAIHPNGRLAQETAEAQLKRHPNFKPGTKIVDMTQDKGRWVAELHEPKVAAPPFATDDTDSPVSDTDTSPKPSGDSEDKSEKKKDNDNKDNETGEKISIEKVFDLVQQIATAVGVAPTPDALPGGPDDLGLEGPPPADGPHGPPHSDGSLPQSPHDETSSVPGSPDTKQIIHRKAPPGATPVGAPAFASVSQPKVASFDVAEVVPNDMPISEIKQEILAQYGQYGYQIKNMGETRDAEGNRVVAAKLSVR